MTGNAATDAPWLRYAVKLDRAMALRLQTSRAETVVVKVFSLVLLAVAVLAFAGNARVTSPPVSVSRSHEPVVAAARDSASDEDVDAYGNEVTNAVAEYSLDPSGALYERHAPQIELPRLGSPKS